MNKQPLLYEQLSYKIRRAIFNVSNTLGNGHKESVYQKALAEELKSLEIPFAREKRIEITYHGKSIGNYTPDFLVDGKVILELKAVQFMPRDHYKQILNYLKGTNIKLGFLVNFGTPKLQIKRLIWTPSPKGEKNTDIRGSEENLHGAIAQRADNNGERITQRADNNGGGS